MRGYQITFMTQQDRRHGGVPLAEWLLRTARELGIRGATLFAADEGYGRGGRIHSAHFFDLTDQPVEVVMAVTEEEAERLFAYLKREQVRVFYVRTEVDFGVAGDAADADGPNLSAERAR